MSYINICRLTKNIYDDGAPENSSPMITGFDLKILTTKCSGSSSSYDLSSSDFDVLARDFKKMIGGYPDRCCILSLLSWSPFTVGW